MGSPQRRWISFSTDAAWNVLITGWPVCIAPNATLPSYPSYFPDKDLVGTLTEGSLEQVEHGDLATRAAAFAASFGKSNFPHPVPVRDIEFRGIFDSDDLVLRGNEGGNGIQERSSFPLAVSPLTNIDIPYSTQIQRYAAAV